MTPQGSSGGAEPHPYYKLRENAHEIWRISWFHSRGGAFDFFDYYCAGGGAASGKAELTGEGHDAEKQQKRRPQKEIDTAENRLSGAVFRNAVGLVGIVIAHHLPPQILLAGKGLAAQVLVGFAVYGVLIGGLINPFPAQPIAAVFLMLSPFHHRFLQMHDLHHGAGGVAAHIAGVFLLCAFLAADTEPARQHSLDQKAGARCDIPGIFYGTMLMYGKEASNRKQ